eukprot:7906755-Heterocapsa_arctica.AAC.1
MIEDMKMDVDGDEKKKKVNVARREGGSEEGERLEARSGQRAERRSGQKWKLPGARASACLPWPDGRGGQPNNSRQRLQA